MNILVTGGAGYIGSTLVPMLLASDHRVRVLDSLIHGGSSLLSVWADPRFEFRLGDLRDLPMVQAALDGVDAVVHLAAIVGDPACARQPELARSVNLDASLALLEASRACGVHRFIFASTCSNYGKMADPTQYVNEASELRPVSLYAETKVAVERALLDPSCTGPICATPLRFATVFGVSPRMRFDLTVNEFTVDMLTKKRLQVFGEQFWRPYVHVRDAARAIETILTSPSTLVKNEVFNVGATEQNYQKRQLIDLVRLHAPEAVVEYVRREEDPRDYRVSFSKISTDLNFQVTRSVAQGIQEVVKLVEDGLIKDFSAPCYRN